MISPPTLGRNQRDVLNDECQRQVVGSVAHFATSYVKTYLNELKTEVYRKLSYVLLQNIL